MSFLCARSELCVYTEIDRLSSEKNQKHMFICFGVGMHDRAASPATIARWVCQTIKAAYADFLREPQHQQIHGVTMHQVRAVATSLAFLDGASIEHMINSGFWRTPSVCYYLSDMRDESDG